MSRASWVAALAAMGLSACVPGFQTNNAADVILRVVTVVPTTGTAGPLISDVISDTNTVVDDNVTVTVDTIPKNANSPTLGQFNDVTLTSYAIQYIRSDGRGVEGIDVPFRIAGNVQGLVVPNSTTSVILVAVRHQAKLEAPLSLLVNLTGGSGVMTLNAKITLYGTTVSGRAVSAVGYIEIIFGNFPG